MAHGPSRDEGLHPAWWTLILVVAIAVAVVADVLRCSPAPSVGTRPVTLTSDRSGLVMESGAKVKLRGVQVGRVASVQGGSEPVALKLEIDPDQIKYIPANVEAQIRATTVFGAKYVDLIYPSDPSPQRLAAGAVLQSRNVSTEVNTVFENLVDVLEQIDPAKLNAMLSALAEGVRGQGERIGQATTDANQVLLALNPRSETMQRRLAGAQGVQRHLQRCGARHPDHARRGQHDQHHHHRPRRRSWMRCCSATIGLSHSGINLLAPNQDNLIKAVNVLEPTTDLLMQVQPGIHLPAGGREVAAGHGWLRSAGWQRRIAHPGRRTVARRRPVPLSGQPADRRRQGRAGRQAGLRIAARRRKNCPVRQPRHQHRLGHRPRLPAQPGHRLPRLGQLLPGHPRGARAAEHPQPLRRAAPDRSRIRARRPTVRTLYAPDGTPLWPGLPPAPPPMAPPRTRPDAGLRAVRGSGARADAADTATTDSVAAGGRHRPHERHRQGHERYSAMPGMRASVRHDAWRLAVFLVVCLLGVFGLFAIFGQLRFEEETTPTRPSSPT